MPSKRPGALRLLGLILPLATLAATPAEANAPARRTEAARTAPTAAAAARPGSGASMPVRLAFLRLGERVGSVIGPFAAAWLLVSAGMGMAVVVIGVVSAVTGVAYAAALVLRRGRGGQSGARP